MVIKSVTFSPNIEYFTYVYGSIFTINVIKGL